MLKTHNITKDFLSGNETIKAVNNISLSVPRGEMLAIMGPSGSGKSTLLKICSGILKPSSGTVIIDDMNLENMNAEKRQEFRRNNIGFIFQQYNLLPTLTVRENIAIPLLIKNVKPNTKIIDELAESVGIISKLDRFPVELSGGEQQRAAIARALINTPKCIFADEPTGNLDEKSTKTIMSILHNINESGSTIIIVTHDSEVSSYCSRVVKLRDGKLVE